MKHVHEKFSKQIPVEIGFLDSLIISLLIVITAIVLEIGATLLFS